MGGKAKIKKAVRLSFAHPGGGKVKIKLSKTEVKKLINDLELSRE